MASPTSRGSRPTVVSFRSLDPGALDELLETQRSEWLERLHWDLGEITSFLSHAIRTRSLKGSAVTVGGTPVGFGFFTFEVDRCLIGDMYVHPDARSTEVNAALAHGILQQIQRSKTRKRIESHSVSFASEGFREVFTDEGFTDAQRLYMTRPTDGASGAADHRRVELRAWRDVDFTQAVEVICQAYRGTVDARMNCQYRTREGCADLLDALTDSAWCGAFSSDMTSVAVDRKSNRICGVAICSRISIAAAHLGQISVLPIYQGEGIGRALVERSLERLWARASDSIPDWLPMRHIEWLPLAYEVAGRFRRGRGGRSHLYLVLLDYSDSRDEPYGLYVGMSHYLPAERFDQHKAGIRAAGSVLRRGLEVLTGPVLHLRYLARAEAAEIEENLAAALRAAGLFVQGGH